MNTGFERIPIPIPIRSLGHVNAYLFPGDYTGIIDPGMLSGRSVLGLVESLSTRGYRTCSIDTVVLTHFHVDHATSSVILGLEGSTIYAGERDASHLNTNFEEFVLSATNLFKEHGAPPREIELMVESHPALRLRYAYNALREIGVKPLREGDRIRLGDRILRVVETPGHTPGSIILVDDELKVAFTGDTLLPGITPHITLHDPNSDPLGDYLSSLRKITELDISIAYPGHRDPIPNPQERAAELIAHHEDRLREIINILESRGPLTAYKIAKMVKWRVRYSSWEEYPYPERFFALSETLAHLRRLEVEEIVDCRKAAGTCLWSLRRA